jgi:hypothetical protein
MKYVLPRSTLDYRFGTPPTAIYFRYASDPIYNYLLTYTTAEYEELAFQVSPVCHISLPAVFISVSMRVCIYLFMCPPIHLPMYLSVCLSVCHQPLCVSVYTSVCLAVCPSVCMSFCMSIDPSSHPPIQPSIRWLIKSMESYQQFWQKFYCSSDNPPIFSTCEISVLKKTGNSRPAMYGGSDVRRIHTCIQAVCYILYVCVCLQYVMRKYVVGLLVSGFSPRRAGFNPRLVHVGFVVDTATQEQTILSRQL